MEAPLLTPTGRTSTLLLPCGGERRSGTEGSTVRREG